MSLCGTLHTTAVYMDVDVPLVIVKDTSWKTPLQILKLRAGQKVKLPYPYALALLREGYAELDLEGLPSYSTLKKLSWAEEKTEDLQPLEEGFYLKVMLLANSLRERARKGDESAEENLRRVRIAFADLVRLRSLKIAQLASKNPTPSKDKMKNMTLEEQILYVTLCELLSGWTRSLVSLVAGGEKV
ncbi:MAG: DNA replication complex GINS family protein [Thermofilum sp.]|jgi:DNA replication factor GINS|nr:DNA replication complex GINS family protein [Thermofilum sp.]